MIGSPMYDSVAPLILAVPGLQIDTGVNLRPLIKQPVSFLCRLDCALLAQRSVNRLLHLA